MLLKVLQRAIMHAGPKKTIDAYRRKAIYNLVKYVVWVLAIMAMLDSVVGGKITFLLAGATALLVAWASGSSRSSTTSSRGMIQIEGTISVGDVIEVEGLVTGAGDPICAPRSYAHGTISRSSCPTPAS
ncbi:MAG: hypothetical protein R2810_06465 [Flavobacteriales bacterium]